MIRRAIRMARKHNNKKAEEIADGIVSFIEEIDELLIDELEREIDRLDQEYWKAAILYKVANASAKYNPELLIEAASINFGTVLEGWAREKNAKKAAE